MYAPGPSSSARRGAGPLDLALEAPAFLGGPFASRASRLAALEAAAFGGAPGAPSFYAGAGPAEAAAAARAEEEAERAAGDRDAAALEASGARHRGRLAQAPSGRDWAWGGGLARAAEAALAPAREDAGRLRR